MWRRRPPDELTPREQEVLRLVRVGLTNEEIAQRLGISLNGARYHVSQILSKLGVATREEAAAVAGGERRRWWASWPLWAKVASGTVAVAAVGGGLALLIYRQTAGPVDEKVENDVGALTVQDAYTLIRESASRRGAILHTTIRHVPTEDGGGEAPDPLSETTELWIDGETGDLRSDITFPRPLEPETRVEGPRFVVAGHDIYSVYANEPVKADATHPALCPGSDDLLLGFLLCGGMNMTDPIAANDKVRLGANGEYDGRPSFVLEFERDHVVDLPWSLCAAGGVSGQPEAIGLPVASPISNAQLRWVSRVHVDDELFLPIARVTEFFENDNACGSQIEEYEHEYLGEQDLPTDWLEPRSVGYIGEPEATP